MTINKKIIVSSTLIASAMTLCAGCFIASAFARMDRREDPGDNLDMIEEYVELVKANEGGMQQIQNILYEANDDYYAKKKRAEVIRPYSSKAKAQKEELDYALVCYANAIDVFQQRMSELNGRVQNELEHQGGPGEGMPPGNGIPPEGAALSPDINSILEPLEEPGMPPVQRKMPLGDKIEIFLTGKTPEGEIWNMPDRESPTRMLINDINEMPYGALKQEIDDSKKYCETTLAKAEKAVKDDAVSSKKSNAPASGSSKSSGSSSKSGSLGSGSSGSSRSSGSGINSSGSSKSSGANSRSSGSYGYDSSYDSSSSSSSGGGSKPGGTDGSSSSNVENSRSNNLE